MKKIILLLLAFVFCVVFSSGCVYYVVEPDNYQDGGFGSGSIPTVSANIQVNQLDYEWEWLSSTSVRSNTNVQVYNIGNGAASNVILKGEAFLNGNIISTAEYYIGYLGAGSSVVVPLSYYIPYLPEGQGISSTAHCEWVNVV